MHSDTFEQSVRGHLEQLQAALAAEHRRAVEKLEARIGTQGKDPPEGPLLGAGFFQKVPSGAPPVGADKDVSLTAQVSPHVPPPSTVQCASAQPAHASERSEGSASQQRLTGDGRLPMPMGPLRACESSDSIFGDGKDAIFRILDIWNKPCLGISSRRTSRQLPSNPSASATSSFCESNVDDDDDNTLLRRVESRLQHFVLAPASMGYLCWELLGLMLVAYDIVTVPLQILNPPETALTQTLSWLVRFFWTLDLVVSFLTGYVSPEGIVELRVAKVAMQYLRTRFIFDLALVSCDWAEALLAAVEGREDASALRMLSVLRAVRLVRLLRLALSTRISEFIFEHIRSEGVKLVAYILAIVLALLGLIHIIACIWHGIHVVDGTERGVADNYFRAYHHTLSLFAGEQVVEPKNLGERLFIIFVLVLAFVASAAFVGSLTTAMTQLQVIASKRSTQFAALNRYLSDYSISRQLAKRVQQNARHALQEQKRHTPESKVELMAIISDPLRSEIHYEVFSPVLTAHPFFLLYNMVNPIGVRHICHMTVAPVTLSRGEVIFSEFEAPVVPHMFFVKTGHLVYARGQEEQISVGSKQWVAEAVLWTKWVHRGTLRALTDSRLLSVDAQRLSNMMSTFPTLHGSHYAERFVQSLNQVADPSDLTDIYDNDFRARTMASNVFQELDAHLEVPWDDVGRPRRPSVFSVSAFAARFSHKSPGSVTSGSRRSSVVSVLPPGYSE